MKFLNGSEGERGSFRCIVEGASEVTWTKVGGDINSQTTIIRGTELFFNNAAVEDRGVYVCGKLQFVYLIICSFACLGSVAGSKIQAT